MGNFLTAAFNTVANWVVTVAEQPWCLTAVVIGSAATVTALVVSGVSKEI